MPWHLRGATDGRAVWKGQALRKSGRYANAGGKNAPLYKVFYFAKADPYFHPKIGGSYTKP